VRARAAARAQDGNEQMPRGAVMAIPRNQYPRTLKARVTADGHDVAGATWMRERLYHGGVCEGRYANTHEHTHTLSLNRNAYARERLHGRARKVAFALTCTQESGCMRNTQNRRAQGISA
jgi:hypothetical protein